ncbi:MAG: YceI family protein [Gemmatimonadales bacterium]
MRAIVLFAVLTAANASGLGGQARAPAARNPEPARFTVATEGNVARFIVREQLAGVTLPSDAVGTTSAITGTIVLDPRRGPGAVDTAVSEIVVDLRTLQTDQQRRDNYIKRRTLVVDSFPHAVLRITELRGFPAAVPASGTFSFTVVGNLTVHGVTKRTEWAATGQAQGEDIGGKAETRVKFGDFGMERPRVMVVLSIEDDIRLQYDFRFARVAEPQ